MSMYQISPHWVSLLIREDKAIGPNRIAGYKIFRRGGCAVSVTTAHDGENLPGRGERAAAMILIAVFVIALIVMALLRSDREWDRLIYLFGGLEAVVFAAAGALFGTSVQRGNLADARNDASQARQEADTARTQAQRNVAGAEKGKVLAEACRAAAQATQAPSERQGARDEMDQFEATSPDLRTLVTLADRLFPTAWEPDLTGEKIG